MSPKAGASSARAHELGVADGRSLVGVAERIDLPEWGIDRLRAKIDTGARSSALHVDEIERLPGERVRFTVVLDKKREHRRVVVEAPIAREATVRPSSGEPQERIFVETTMRLGPVEKTIEVSLACRAPMMFRMLLGRTALAHDFLVDPAYRYLHKKPRKAPMKKKTSAKKRPKATKKKTARPRRDRGSALEPQTEEGGTPSPTPKPKKHPRKKPGTKRRLPRARSTKAQTTARTKTKSRTTA